MNIVSEKIIQLKIKSILICRVGADSVFHSSPASNIAKSSRVGRRAEEKPAGDFWLLFAFFFSPQLPRSK